MTALEISGAFVEIAKKNAEEAGVDVNFTMGSASEMPFQSDMFDFVISVLAFKNFKEPLKALNEMHRVLKPGGKALIVDLDRNSSLRAVKEVANRMGISGLMAYVAGAIQRHGAYSRDDFESMISQTDFKSFEIQETQTGFSVHLKKGSGRDISPS